MSRSTSRSRSHLLLLLVVAMVLSMTGIATAQDHDGEEYEVLFFHRTTGFRHGSIPAAITAVEELGAANGFTVTETQDPTVFTDEGLRPYAAIVFFTDGEGTLNHSQRTAFERYIHRGGGFVGLHSTTNTDKADWPWWEDLLGGAFFASHPPIQDGTILVEDSSHPATAHLPAEWEWPADEWYHFTANPRDGGAHILMTVDEASYSGGQMGDDHPIAWCNAFDGGRTFYTAIGHSSSHYSDANFRQHILGGIEWAAGVADGDCGEPREGPPTDAAFEKVALDDNTINPMKLDVMADGRVIYTELAGSLKIYDPATQAITVAAEIDVYRDQENGLIGVALDPDFEDNGWVYLFYSDPVEAQQHVSRFALDSQTNTLDLSSERVLLEIPHQRDQCCHSSGDLAFGPDGSLYISTGDDTNPFGSQSYAPIDYRDGRAAWDAARSSGNTADLRGKILRIVPMDDPGDTPGPGSTYTIPDDNLFTEANDTWHHLFPDGQLDPELAYPEIYVMGLRNPFGIAVDPETGWLYVGDVGPDSNPSGGSNPQRGPRGYDSWTQVREPANYGWPFCYIVQEPYRQWDFATQTAGDYYDCAGGAVNDSPRNTGLEKLPAARERTIWYPYCPYTAPNPFPEIPSGNVSGGQNYGCGRAAFMGDIYNFDPGNDAEGRFPEYYDGKPFVLEWERDIIASITLDEAGEYVSGSFEEFMHRARYSPSTRFRKPHALRFGPDGNMYLIEWGDDFNFAGGGANADSGLYRISYVKGGRTPVARASASPDSGQPPLEVAFSSEGSFDPDGQAISYSWSFGDGATSTEANPTHTYTETGSFTAQLTVTDDTDSSSSSSVTITVGNTRPEITIEFPHHGQVFDWGDEIPFSVTVVDAEEGSTSDGTIDCQQVTVQRSLWHSSGEAAHVHPGPSQQGCEGTIVTQADADHGDDAHIATVVTASYTDDGGEVGVPLTGGVTNLLQPRRKQAHHTTDASGVTRPSGGGITGSNGAWASYSPLHLEGIDVLTLRAAALDDTTIEVRRDAPDGPLLGTAEIEATAEVERISSREGFGNAVRLNGPSPNQYVELPEGVVSDLDADFTIATWINRGQTGQEWNRVFDFGTNTSNYMFMSANAGGANNGLRFAITTAGNQAEQIINYSQQVPTGWQHVAVTVSGTTGRLWLNGQNVATNANITLRPSDLGVTPQNWIGRSQWAADPLINAAFDDFHIFDQALSQSEVQALMASPGGGDLGGGNVAWYRFDESGGATALDASGEGNHGRIVVAGGAATFTNVEVDLAATAETFPVYLVFPGTQATVSWLHFGPDEGGSTDPDPDPDPPHPCEPVPVEDVDEFPGEALHERWTVHEPSPEHLSVSDGSLRIQTVQGRDFFAGDGTLPNVVTQTMPDGSWTATTTMTWAPTQNFQNAGMVLYTDEGHYLKAGLVHANNLAFELIKEVGNSPSFLGNVAAPAGFPAQYQLRMASDGSEVTAQFSADGAAWTTIGTATLDGLGDPGVGVYATNSTAAGATNPPVATFERFALEYEAVPEAGSVTDRFDGDELDTCRWNRVVRFDDDTLEVSDGHLRVDTSPEDIFGADNTDPTNFVLQSMPDGDWTIETKMTAPLERSFQNAGFLVYGDDDNYLKAGIVAVNDPGAPRELVFEMATEIGGQVQFPLVNEATPDSTIDGWWLQLAREGDSYTLSWSLDGADFTPLSAGRSIQLDDPAFGLYAIGTSLQDTPVTVSWEYFELLGELEVPAVSATTDPAEPDGDGGWYRSPVTVTLESDDPEASLSWRAAGDADWADYTEPFVVADDGEHEIQFRATGATGSSPVGTIQLAIDGSPPATGASLEGEQDGEVYTGPVTLTLDAQDETSGVAETHYRSAGDSEHEVYTDPLVFTEPGEITVEFRSVDVAGNVEEWESVTFTIAEEPAGCEGTVIVDGVDSGVAEREVDDGCIADLLGSRADHRNQGQWTAHVRSVTDRLVADGVITRDEAQSITRAASPPRGRT